MQQETGYWGLDRRLFELDKTVRDPVHGDIMVTRIEVRVMDTAAFQRLRSIKQLGTADWVYPSARHTRFEHSLGTLAMAERIVNAINSNPKNASATPPISEEGRHFTRLLALLHDIGHVPYGHTLEDETGVLETKHDADKVRLDHFLEFDTPRSIAHTLGPQLRDLVTRALLSKTDEDIAAFEYPYAIDIVSNTVCADLLDYLKRDAYFTGLRQAYDDRFISYFMLYQSPIAAQTDDKPGLASPYENRPILVIKKGDRVKWSVLSEVLKLLRLRYELGERVYYHHTKVVTSAMLSRAVGATGWHLARMQDWGDDVLLHEIEAMRGKGEGPELARRLVRMLKRRELYKPVYVVSRVKADAHCSLPRFQEFHDSAEARLGKEREFCKTLELPEGSVIFYAPDPRMSLKEAGVKVRWIDDTVLPLSSIPEIQSEKIEPLHRDHRTLWAFYVLLDPAHFDRAVDLAQLCFEEWGIKNDIASLSSYGVPVEFRALLVAAEERDLKASEMRIVWDKVRARAARTSPGVVSPGESDRRNKEFWLEQIDLYQAAARSDDDQLFSQD